MSIYRREIETQCCNQWMNGIRTINGQYPDDNRDFDINAGSGIVIQPATGGITIINSAQAQAFVAGDNIEITPSGNDLEISLKDDIVRTGSTALTGDVAITGDLQVNGDIVQQGSAYETHAEKVFTANDYITMRDGAVAALAPGDYSGFQVKKYDGTNDGRLVIDNAGTARVGDVGDEQPLLTRDEAADLTDGAVLKWDAANFKAVNEGTVGDDTHPLKSVNGVLTPVTNELALASAIATEANTIPILEGSGSIIYCKFGKVVIINIINYAPIAAGTRTIANLPYTQTTNCYGAVFDKYNHQARILAVEHGRLNLEVVAGDSLFIGQVVYITT